MENIIFIIMSLFGTKVISLSEKRL
jgi:hypothetical protein